MTPPQKQLKDIVAAQLEIHWTQFQQEHPHLAAAIERTRLIESTVARITDDPQYKHAMRLAAQDEGMQETVEKLKDLADRWLRAALGL
jgi:hypothetical protein